MTKPIRTVAVLGSGVMGGGIAAHLANAGIPVLLLDIVPPKLTDAERASKAARDSIAAGAKDKLKKAKPAAFSHVRNAELIRTGNFDDDLAKVAECDLIVEAIIERLDIKQALFAKLDALLSGETIIASNTSGLRIAEMLEGRSQRFKEHFLVTHFFNPPRYMKLLELVAGPDTSDACKARVTHWGKDQLGKGIVWAKDTPNFVANRIGTHAMMASIHLMMEKGLAPEDLDNLTGVPMGHPKSASFRTADLVGLDTLAHVVDNCYRSLTTDEDREVFTLPAYVKTMVERGILGDKTKGGFYKRAGKDVLTLDPKTGEYRAKGGDEAITKACKGLNKVEDVRERVKKLVATPGVVGEFAWQALSKSLAYSARRLGEICDDVTAIDDGMKWGYNWDLGPFETWDALGFADTTKRMKAEGIALPAWVDAMVAAGATGFYREGEIWSHTKGAYVARATDAREVTFDVMKRGGAPVLKNNGAEAWDLGDGILGLTFKTKANSIDADVIKMLHEATAKAETDFRGMVIYNTGEFFCVGANLFAVVMAAQQKQWDGLREMIHGYQYATQRLKYAKVPVVAAPYNMTLGGGLELCYGCDGVQAAARDLRGPGRGRRGPHPRRRRHPQHAVALARGGARGRRDRHPGVRRPDLQEHRAGQGRDLGRRGQGVRVLPPDRRRVVRPRPPAARGQAARHRPGRLGLPPADPAQLQAARRERHRDLADDGQHAGGRRLRVEHDGKIAMKLANVLCGGAAGGAGPVDEDRMLELEREAFLSLCGEPKSQERMQYMLMNQKPLRN
jgi:3-hydroxyacyl-CoA dehydrogenase